MLDDFIGSHHDAIVARTRTRFASRTSRETDALSTAIPMFLGQLCAALKLARSSDVVDHVDISERASRHGQDLLHEGFTIAQVVHDYGDVCQVITELAEQKAMSISGEEFRTLNLCLDDAIAGAVTEYSRGREHAIARDGTERLGVLADELRNRVNAAVLAFDVIKGGRVAAGGSTGLLLERSLNGLRDLIDRSLAEVRIDAGIRGAERISLAELAQEAEIGAAMQANAHGVHLTVTSVDPGASVEGDRQVLAAAISNLLQNALKFTHRGGHVTFTARATDARVLFEIEDECGGLPEGTAETLFRPFEQRGADRNGVGLGLSICWKVAKAHAGELRVRNLPGKGCVFTLDLPKQSAR